MLRLSSILTVVLGVFANVGWAAEPAVKHENIEWAQIWIPDNARTDLPRVLLIGDSICNAYYDGVAQTLKDKAIVAKMATSYCLADPVLLSQVQTLLATYKFSVIHFNNGLHGFDYTEAEYAKQFPDLIKVIRQSAPNAKLIWATSTAMRNGANLKEFLPMNDRVKARNKIVIDLAAKENIPVNDLYGLTQDHPEYWGNDGVHFKPEGVAAEAKQVAEKVQSVLGK